jgi:hypothetical protein
VSCTSGDTAFDAVKQAIENASKNPDSSYRTLETKLSKVKDKTVIPILLNYFRESLQQGRSYPGILGLIGLYFEDLSGIKGRVSVNIAGPAYSTDKGWEGDVAQWQNWWNTNKDYIYWDEHAQSLKVQPH